MTTFVLCEIRQHGRYSPELKECPVCRKKRKRFNILIAKLVKFIKG